MMLFVRVCVVTTLVLTGVGFVDGQDTCVDAAGDCSFGKCTADRRAEVPLESDFWYPSPLQPGQAEPLRWRQDNKTVCPYTVAVGLPPNLRETLLQFAEEKGIVSAFRNAIYEKPLNPKGLEFLFDEDKVQGKWCMKRPQSFWKSDMHWIDVADEASYEESLQVLAQGGFDTVLDAVGNYYGLDSQMIHTARFMAVSQCSKGHIHEDMSQSGGKYFNILIPLLNEDGADDELLVVDDEDEDRVGTLKYEYNVGILFGDDCYHATRPANYREQKGMRLTANIYFADVNDDNVKEVAYDPLSIFPVHEHHEWFLSQKGRHWGRGKSLVNDPGRKPFEVKDEYDECKEWAEEGYCESDHYDTRLNCMKSCKLFLADE